MSHCECFFCQGQLLKTRFKSCLFSLCEHKTMQIVFNNSGHVSGILAIGPNLVYLTRALGKSFTMHSKASFLQSKPYVEYNVIN